MKCPNCGSIYLHCPECGKRFHHGAASHCDNPSCVKVNAPLDCHCGLVASADLKGVPRHDMTLWEYQRL